MDEDPSSVVSPITGGAERSATAFDKGNPDDVADEVIETASEAEQPMEEENPSPTVFVSDVKRSGFADDEEGLSGHDEAGSSAHLDKKARNG